jgi:hypothetical protein
MMRPEETALDENWLSFDQDKDFEGLDNFATSPIFVIQQHVEDALASGSALQERIRIREGIEVSPFSFRRLLQNSRPL